MMVDCSIKQNRSSLIALVPKIRKCMPRRYGAFHPGRCLGEKFPGVFLTRHPLNNSIVVFNKPGQFTSDQPIHIPSREWTVNVNSVECGTPLRLFVHLRRGTHLWHACRILSCS